MYKTMLNLRNTLFMFSPSSLQKNHDIQYDIY